MAMHKYHIEIVKVERLPSTRVNFKVWMDGTTDYREEFLDLGYNIGDDEIMGMVKEYLSENVEELMAKEVVGSRDYIEVEHEDE